MLLGIDVKHYAGPRSRPWLADNDQVRDGDGNPMAKPFRFQSVGPRGGGWGERK